MKEFIEILTIPEKGEQDKKLVRDILYKRFVNKGLAQHVIVVRGFCSGCLSEGRFFWGFHQKSYAYDDVSEKYNIFVSGYA